jgi:uncharacterized repeat protein (TIGR01451 family)
MKKLISRVLGSLPKRIVAGSILALAVALPVAVSAAQTVQIEAHTEVANVNDPNSQYASSTNASYDQVVKVQVVYDNDEAANSGKVANNLRVKINIPSTAGKTQTITTTTSADNSNTVNGSVTVNLDSSNAYLQYEPNTAVWAHSVNGKVVTQNLGSNGDGIVSGNGIVLENENPCQAGSVTVLARVMVPGVRIVKQSEVLGQSNAWSNNNTAKPGDTLKYMITYQNVGNTEQKNVVIGDNLPPEMTLVPNTTLLYNSAYNGKLLSTNNITSGGVTIGSYMPGATAYIVFEVKVPSVTELACGNTEFRNVGVVQPQGMGQYYNTAITNVMKQCSPSTPTYACTAFDVTKGDNRTVTVSKFQTTATGGATFKDAVIDWGDQSTPLTTTNPQGQKYQYAKDGAYTINATAHFDVNGKDVVASCPAQTVSYNTPTTPTTPTSTTELPNTGAGNVIGLFAAATVAGFIGFRLFLGRRLARR